MLVDKTMIISIQIKSFEIFKNRDYNFYSRTERMLGPEGRYFAHMTGLNIVAVQVQNIAVKLYIISKNFKIGHFRDYDKEGCFMIDPKDYYFAVILVRIVDIKGMLNINKETVLSNKITIYGDKITVDKIIAITEETSKV